MSRAQSAPGSLGCQRCGGHAKPRKDAIFERISISSFIFFHVLN